MLVAVVSFGKEKLLVYKVLGKYTRYLLLVLHPSMLNTAVLSFAEKRCQHWSTSMDLLYSFVASHWLIQLALSNHSEVQE